MLAAALAIPAADASSPHSAPSTTNGNGISHTPTIAPGVYAPLNTFFLPGSQDLDIPTLKRHAVRIAGAGGALRERPG